jgi:alpha-L-rhamnosidase
MSAMTAFGCSTGAKWPPCSCVHYALGGVADWLHQTIGGIAPDAPGFKRLRFAPEPGRGVERGSSTLRTPYGRATVVRPGRDEEPLTVAAGKHRWTYAVPKTIAAEWVDAPSGGWSGHNTVAPLGA